MKNKHHIFLYSFLSVALVVTVILSFTYFLESRAAAQALEDVYIQRLMETQEQLQSMSLKLSKVPVATDDRTLCELLTGVSRQADGVVSNLSALPLSHPAMGDTIKFCNQLSEYTLGLALSLAGGAELTQENQGQLADMQSQCMLLLGQFVTAQDTMLRQSLILRPSESVYYQEAQLEERPLEQVADKDNGMDYPTLIYDGAFSDARHYGTPKALGTETITEAQALELAVRYIGADRVQDAKPSVKTEGPLASYGVSLMLKEGLELTAEVTKTGGKLLWIVPEHANFPATLTLEECTEAGARFLRENGYGTMEANHYQVYDGLAVINFVAVQDEVLLYPDLVKLQLRMDTGEVVGLESNNYLMNHVTRQGLTPALTQEQALAKASDRLNVRETRLCVIPYRDGERLCYELKGTCDDNEYRVYIDAQTGAELEVLMILRTGDGMLSA